MKLNTLTTLLGTLASLVPISASAFVTAFDEPIYTTSAMEIAGTNNWVINNASVDPLPGYFLSYLVSMPYKAAPGNLSKAAELGGYKDAPLSSPNPVYLSQPVPGELKNTSFSVDFSIRGNSPFMPPGTPRDAFGFSLLGALDTNLVTILLSPEAGGTGDAYRIGYTVGSGAFVPATNFVTGDPMYAHASSYWTLDFKFITGGANPDFEVIMQSLDTAQPPEKFQGTATGQGAASMESFAARWDVIGGGDNGMQFDNLSVVPEPSSVLLLGLAGLGLVSRRRRV